MSAPTIGTVEGIHVRHRSWELGPVDMTLPRGCTALLGTNGAGKTTLMRAMLGLQAVAAGTFLVGGPAAPGQGGHPVGHADRDFRSRVGYLPQRPAFPRFVTARQALAYAADLKGMRGEAAERAVAGAAARTDVTALLDRPASRLSGGQQQRLALAQATVHDPALVLLDEPTAGLDPLQRRDFRAWLRDYCATSSALVSTHLIEDVEPIADHVVVLHDGHVVFSGTPAALAERAGGADGLEGALWNLLAGARA